MSNRRFQYSYKRKGASLLLWGILILCIAVILFCGYKITVSSLEYNAGNDVYEELAQNKSNDNKVDFNALKTMNPDVVGWISRPGIGLDYPIVQGTDNDYYLTHLADRSVNKLGSIFMDYRNDPGFADKNTILYGHNMKDGAMFAVLMQYTEQKFFNDYPWIAISTPERNYKMQIFAGYTIPANEFDAALTFNNNVEFMNYVNATLEKSTIKSRVAVKPTDKLITLYTCSYDYQDARYVLVGVLR